MKEKILIVDDEKDIVKMLEYNLKKEEFRVFSARNGESALEIVKKENPDIIILDLLMPHIGGFEICELLNKDDETKGVPVIVTTALSDTADIKKAYKVGASGYLVKPLEFKQLVEEINKALNL